MYDVVKAFDEELNKPLVVDIEVDKGPYFSIDISSLKTELLDLGLTDAEREAWLRGEFDIWDIETKTNSIIREFRDYGDTEPPIYVDSRKAISIEPKTYHYDESFSIKSTYDIGESYYSSSYAKWEQRRMQAAKALDKRRKANKAARKARRR